MFFFYGWTEWMTARKILLGHTQHDTEVDVYKDARDPVSRCIINHTQLS